MPIPSDLQRDPAVQDLVNLFDSRFFAALSEPVRVEILKLLIVCGRADIAAIAQHLPQDRSVISRHLKLMEEAGILMREKEGRHVYYQVSASGVIGRLEAILAQVKTAVAACCPDR